MSHSRVGQKEHFKPLRGAADPSLAPWQGASIANVGACTSLSPLPFPPADFVVWQRVAHGAIFYQEQAAFIKVQQMEDG